MLFFVNIADTYININLVIDLKRSAELLTSAT
jgi:hypothetical protein